MNTQDLPECWQTALQQEFELPYFTELQAFIDSQRAESTVFPAHDDVFNALNLTPLQSVRVLILGQDPYHDDNQAHGLSFSVQHGVRVPPSLRNIYKELEADLGIPAAVHGHLSNWARQGVLLLNTVLTVRAHEPNSHQKRGWETFTSRVLECVNAKPAVAFVLWGKPAQTKAPLIDDRHLVIQTAHPSPLSARRGFFGSKLFSKINQFLEAAGEPAIDWRLDDCQE